MGTYILNIDYFIYSWLFALREDNLTLFFKLVTLFGSWKFIFPAAVIISVFLYHRRLYSFISTLWVVLIATETATFILKILVARPRPSYALVIESDFSFPSGHTTIAVAFYGFIMFTLLSHIHIRWGKNLTIGVGVSIMLLIGLSRLYLGAHYLSDVIAGYALGLVGLSLGMYVSKLYIVANKK